MFSLSNFPWLSEMIAQSKDLSVHSLKAVIMLVVGYVTSKWLGRSVKKLIARFPQFDTTIGLFFAGSIHYGIMALVFIAVLAQFGVETTSIVTVLGTAGLAIGLALQGTLSNIASGLMILILRPFKVGEYIEAGEIAGTVEMIGLFSTQMSTVDGIYLTATNSQLWTRTIKNFTRNQQRRIDIAIAINYENRIPDVISLLLEVLAKETVLLRIPAPQVYVKELNTNFVNLNVRCWTKQEDFWPTYFDLNKKLLNRLQERKVALPYYPPSPKLD